MKAILQTAAGNQQNQDRGLIFRNGPRLVLCVADGAGGRSGGAEAAEMAVAFIREHAAELTNYDACAEVLRKMDAAIAHDPAAGETTCALAVVGSDGIFGASVGDSGIWLIPEAGNHLELTRAQQRKPFIGAGAAWPMPFTSLEAKGFLLLATDGLLKYTSAEQIVKTCREHPVEVAANRLIELVRYASGALPDDVTVILASL
jgi:serine/threonine protein phosphatase PrpC